MNIQTFISEVLQYAPFFALFTVSACCVLICLKASDKISTAAGKGVQGIGIFVAYLYKNFTDIKNAVTKVVWTRTSFFHFGVLVCMTASVVHGSHLFSNKENVPALNYLLAATFDIGIWFLMQSSIYLKRQGKDLQSFFLMAIIVVLCLFSFAANLIYSIQYYSPVDFSFIDQKYKNGIIVLQSCPPLVIVTLTLVASIFTKKDVNVEDITLAQRLEERNNKKLARIEYRLKLKQGKRDLQAKYTQGPAAEDTVNLQPVAFSFFGFKLYQKAEGVPAAEVAQIGDTLQKLSIAVYKLQQSSAPCTEAPQGVQAPVTCVEVTESLNSLQAPEQLTGPVERTTDSLQVPLQVTSPLEAVGVQGPATAKARVYKGRGK